MAAPVPLARQIAAAEREIGMRKRCYPGWVKRNKMTQAAADDELSAMQAVLSTLRAVEALEPGCRACLAALIIPTTERSAA